MVDRGFDGIELYPQEMKCPTILLLDVSGSMDGKPIDELSSSVKAFKETLLNDEKARKVVDIAIVTFGGKVETYEFRVPELLEDPNFQASGDTPMGEAILKALNMLDERKKEYNQNGVNYYRPWLIIITDGYPTDMKPGESKWNDIRDKIRDGENRKKFITWVFGTSTANFDALVDLFPNVAKDKRMWKINDFEDYKKVFLWLSNSLSTVSRSKHGEKIRVDAPPAEKIELEI